MTGSESSGLVERLDRLATRVETQCGPSAKMVWRRWGKGRPVVLLHGGAGSWMHWIKNIDALARSRTVWVPDLPGFGDSDLPAENLDADSLAPFVLHGALEVLQGERFDLVGFSFGGLVSALIAAHAPATLDRLVLVSVAGMGLLREAPVLKPLRLVKDAEERREVLRFNLNALMLWDPSSIDDLAIAIQGASAPRDRVKNRKLVLTDILPTLVAQWRCEAFGIWARQDVLYRQQFGKLIERVDQLGLRECVYFDHAGHWLQYERCNEFDRVLARILDSPLIRSTKNQS